MKKETTKPAPATNRKAQNEPEKSEKDLDFSANIPSYLIIQKRLGEPIPPELVFEKERGGKSFPFMNITDCTDLLDERAGIWQNFVTNERQVGNDYIVTVRIEILAAEGWIAREDTGIEEINLSSYGDTASNAFAMAFKRAASKHGLGRDLWRKHDYFASEPRDIAERRREAQNEIAGERSNVPASGNRSNAAAGKPLNPLAANVGDLLTGKQIGMIHGRAKDLNIDANEFVYNHLGCKVDELARKAASWVIDNLGVLPINPNQQTAPASSSNEPPRNVATFPSNNKPENFKDDAPAANAGQIKALQVTIDNVLNNKGIDESVVLSEFAAVGCRSVSFAANGEFMTENLTGERAGALIKRFNYILDHGV